MDLSTAAVPRSAPCSGRAAPSKSPLLAGLRARDVFISHQRLGLKGLQVCRPRRAHGPSADPAPLSYSFEGRHRAFMS